MSRKKYNHFTNSQKGSNTTSGLSFLRKNSERYFNENQQYIQEEFPTGNTCESFGMDFVDFGSPYLNQNYLSPNINKIEDKSPSKTSPSRSQQLIESPSPFIKSDFMKIKEIEREEEPNEIFFKEEEMPNTNNQFEVGWFSSTSESKEQTKKEDTKNENLLIGSDDDSNLKKRKPKKTEKYSKNLKDENMETDEQEVQDFKLRSTTNLEHAMSQVFYGKDLTEEDIKNLTQNQKVIICSVVNRKFDSRIE